MSLLIQALAIASLVLGGFFVFLPSRREHFAGVFTLSVLALVLCSGFRTLSADGSAPAKRGQEIAANVVRAK